jgi:hypothetical protein
VCACACGSLKNNTNITSGTIHVQRPPAIEPCTLQLSVLCAGSNSSNGSSATGSDVASGGTSGSTTTTTTVDWFRFPQAQACSVGCASAAGDGDGSSDGSNDSGGSGDGSGAEAQNQFVLTRCGNPVWQSVSQSAKGNS